MGMETMLEPDGQLIREFNDRRDEQAFAALVERHVQLVFTTALRQLGDHGLAEEVTQNVFIALAQSSGKLGRHPTLVGWLHRTALNKSRERMRAERRRWRREQIAVNQEQVRTDGDSVWSAVLPLLAEALLGLREADRLALIMHFMEGRSFGEVGVALGVGEDAARKRVDRCLDQLTRFFRRHGLVVPTLAAGAPLFVLSSPAAPAGLATSAVTAGLAADPAAAGGSILTLIKGALKIMAWTKVKTVVVGAAAILAVSTATVAVKMSYFPAIKDSFFQPNYRHFQNLPNDLFVLRPTHFGTPPKGLDYSAEGSSPSGEHVTRMMGRNRSFEQLVARIYSCSQSQIVFPAGVPKAHFDYLFTILDNHAQERFEAVIKKKPGYVAGWQEHNTDTFLLKVQPPNAPRLKPGGPPNNSTIRRNSPNQLEFRNRPLRDLASEIENSANVPVREETGLTDAFNFDLDCSQTDLADRNWEAINEALGRLGLELVRTNQPLKMLVVQPAI
jgi:uncharacterized protein (TIGR03435 family)